LGPPSQRKQVRALKLATGRSFREKMKSDTLSDDGSLKRSAVSAYDMELRSMRRVILVCSYLTYACFYLSRKADSVVKIALHEAEGFSVEDLAMLDTVYFIVYASSTMALAASGVHKLDSGKLLCAALFCLAGTSWLKSQVHTPMQFAGCQVLHAFFQSAGWPTCVRIVGSWVTENRGFVMGIWTTCQSLGGILGAVWATYFMSHYSWTASYQYHVPLMMIMGVVCYFFIRDEPPKSRFVDNNVDLEAKRDYEDNKGKEDVNAEESVSLMKVVMLPGVMWICIAYFFLKFLRYALLMWLPYYYEEGLHFDQSIAGYMSSSFEIGGLVGTPLIGWFSDQVLQGRRDLTAAWFLSGASIMLMACALVASAGVTLNAVSMFLVGILVIGPDSIISGTIAQDVGSASPMGYKAIGTLAGLINSVGSCGSIFQSYATAFISRTYGWSILFTVFVACSMWSACILFAVSHKNKPATTWLTDQKVSVRIVSTCATLFILYIFILGGKEEVSSSA